MHDGPAIEALGQAGNVDGDLFCRAIRHRRTSCWSGPSVTVTGWPAVSAVASPSGRASTRKTSFCRCSREKITGGVNSASRAMKLIRSEEHTSELQSHVNLVCRLLLEKKKKKP